MYFLSQEHTHKQATLLHPAEGTGCVPQTREEGNLFISPNPHYLECTLIHLRGYFQTTFSKVDFVIYIYACMLSRFSLVQLCATLWTAAHQAPLSTGFSRQEYWSGWPFPSYIYNVCIYIHINKYTGEQNGEKT